MSEFEGALHDGELAGADLKAKVGEAWRDFARQLAEALPQIAAGTSIDLTLDPTASGTGDAVYSVEITAEEGGTFVASAVGNADLPVAFRLDRGAIADLIALGWSPPGVVAGSRDSFGVRVGAAEINRLAVLATRTLRDVYGAPHPAFLTYFARNAGSEDLIAMPPLASARSLMAVLDTDGDGTLSTDESATGRGTSRLSDAVAGLPLAEQVTTVVARLQKTTPEALSVDPDGDISIRAGSAMVFVRVRDSPPLIDVFSPLLTEVPAGQKLYAKLSELTNRMPIGRLYHSNETVWASVPVFGRDFQPTHLMLAVQVMTGLADELDDRLQVEFGGRRFFSEGDKPPAKDSAERTGMYL
ncbi:MAG TPA: hypothetical protein VK453_03495 [Micromonosporaceae bacterium]|nr:hypothetical protein [Micromonosporaceae bacterium]